MSLCNDEGDCVKWFDDDWMRDLCDLCDYGETNQFITYVWLINIGGYELVLIILK